MEYKLTVLKLERNPKYSPKQDQFYSHKSEEPEYLTCNEMLIVTLTEEEFVAIKKAVIEVIKQASHQQD